jgi:uncharacterized ParB-like nuclease family protein
MKANPNTRSTNMNEQMLDIAKIRIDGDTQPRLAIEQVIVAEYADLLESGTEFPPVQVVSDGAVHWLVDGFHRYFAHRKLGRKQIKAEVTTGLQEEAQWLSLTANKAHGLRRTNQDKAKAVIRALKMKPELSDNAIAEHIGVSNRMVAKYRESIESRKRARQEAKVGTGQPTSDSGVKVSHLTTRAGLDGKRYAVKAKPKGGISPKAFTPTRQHSQPVDSKTPISMPQDPDMGAHTLFDLFDQTYIRRLVARLQSLLDGTAGPAPVLREIAAATKN